MFSSLCFMRLCFMLFFLFKLYGDHRDLHVLTHSFPTRRSSDLLLGEIALTHEVQADYGQAERQLNQALALLGAQYPETVALNGARADRKSTRLNSSH